MVVVKVYRAHPLLVEPGPEGVEDGGLVEIAKGEEIVNSLKVSGHGLHNLCPLDHDWL